MVFLLVTFLASICSNALADYACLCSYATDKPVYAQPTPTSNIIGHLYEFDCKPEYTLDTSLAADWKAVMIDHHIGYFKDTTAVSSEICQGSIPTVDKVTRGPSTTYQVTTSTTISTTSSSTTESTTAISSNTPISNSISLHGDTSSTPTTLVSALSKNGSTSIPLISSPISSSKKSVTTTSIPVTTSKFSTSVSSIKHTTSQFSSVSSQTKPSPSTDLPTKLVTTLRPTSRATTKKTTTTKRVQAPTIYTTQPPPITPKVSIGPVITHPPTITYKCPDNVLRAAHHNNGRTRVYGATCYELVPYYYTWYDAEANCKNKGGHLVHVQNMVDENNLMRFLYDYNFKHTVWLGLTDLHQENHFYWTSGDPVTFTKWRPDHINNFDNHYYEDCVVLVPYIKAGFLGSHGLWDDIHCSDGHPWVCQYQATPVQALFAHIFGNGGYNHGSQQGHNHLVFTTKTPVIGGLDHVLDIIGRK